MSLHIDSPFIFDGYSVFRCRYATVSLINTSLVYIGFFYIFFFFQAMLQFL